MSKKDQKVPTLLNSKKSQLATQIRVQEIATLVTEKGYGRHAVQKYCVENWGISEKQAEKYYYAAINYLKPDNPEEYREALIARNFGVLETMLQKALDNNDLQTANQVIKTMNTMLNVGDRKVQLEQGDTKIVVSFGD